MHPAVILRFISIASYDYLRKGGYVFTPVCWSVCLSVCLQD